MCVRIILFFIALTATCHGAKAQEKTVGLKYGNMDSWVTRTIH